jgi:hypothetical protein
MLVEIKFSPHLALSRRDKIWTERHIYRIPDGMLGLGRATTISTNILSLRDTPFEVVPILNIILAQLLMYPKHKYKPKLAGFHPLRGGLRMRLLRDILKPFSIRNALP